MNSEVQSTKSCVKIEARGMVPQNVSCRFAPRDCADRESYPVYEQMDHQGAHYCRLRSIRGLKPAAREPSSPLTFSMPRAPRFRAFSLRMCVTNTILCLKKAKVRHRVPPCTTQKNRIDIVKDKKWSAFKNDYEITFDVNSLIDP